VKGGPPWRRQEPPPGLVVQRKVSMLMFMVFGPSSAWVFIYHTALHFLKHVHFVCYENQQAETLTLTEVNDPSN